MFNFIWILSVWFKLINILWNKMHIYKIIHIVIVENNELVVNNLNFVNVVNFKLTTNL